MLLNKNEFYMNRCFALAKKGMGTVSPNPLVGAVIVHNDRVIGEGWHEEYGQAHAEVNAIASVAKKDEQLLPEATIYVNLEPCSHVGKTPPCAHLLVEKGIRNVVIANKDSNPKVAGQGIAYLQQHGVSVATGILENQGKWLNRRFFTAIEKQRPYIILKWAQSQDHFFAKNDGKQHWITNELSRRLVHKWRSEEDAILVGTNTLKIDNPKLTNRFFQAEKQPVKVAFDRHVSTPKTHHFFTANQPAILINEIKNSQENNLQYCQLEFDNNLIINTLSILHKQQLQSVIIEGGAHTLQHFINQNYWDEARILIGARPLNNGIPAPKISGNIVKEFSLQEDRIQIIKNTTCTT